MFFSRRVHSELGEVVARESGTKSIPMIARDLANGEIFVCCEESVRGPDAFVLQAHPVPLNKWLVEQLIVIDILKRDPVKCTTAILPPFSHARQDKKHRGREPISARLVADLLKAVGADRIVPVDLHTDQIQGFFDDPVDHMYAVLILSEYIKKNCSLGSLVVVSPDAGRVKVPEKWASTLGDIPLAFIHKTRSIDVVNQVVVNRVVGGVPDKTYLLIDDMIDTGGVIAGVVKVLCETGTEDAVIATTHGVFSDPARECLSKCGAREAITTDILPQSTEGWDNLIILPIALLLAKIVYKISENDSVTTLFEGQA